MPIADRINRYVRLYEATLFLPMSTSTLRLGEEQLSHICQPLRTWSQLWQAREILNVRIEFSKRMRTSLGRCYPRRKIVRLNEILLLPGNEDLITEVACHEVCGCRCAGTLRGRLSSPWSGVVQTNT